eukprot:TRINITY_DN21804_c0_g1_i1.p1 TRINITY_DN21804_c0_g1~~TRINITY_DN21804_c0_g1_i1.p1  ORF type:complete len:229 (-),score=36.28 TRINITY_DN21804_c0_g1_i1:24-659(-)
MSDQGSSAEERCESAPLPQPNVLAASPFLSSPSPFPVPPRSAPAVLNGRPGGRPIKAALANGQAIPRERTSFPAALRRPIEERDDVQLEGIRTLVQRILVEPTPRHLGCDPGHFELRFDRGLVSSQERARPLHEELKSLPQAILEIPANHVEWKAQQARFARNHGLPPGLLRDATTPRRALAQGRLRRTERPEDDITRRRRLMRGSLGEES